jgi:hypothetical protein
MRFFFLLVKDVGRLKQALCPRVILNRNISNSISLSNLSNFYILNPNKISYSLSLTNVTNFHIHIPNIIRLATNFNDV